MVQRLNYGGNMITIPGSCYAFGDGTKVNQDVGRFVPEVEYSVTYYQVPPGLDPTLITGLTGTRNTVPLFGLGSRQGPAGLAFYDQRPPEFWAKLTAFGSGHYTALEQVRTGVSTWQAGPRTVSAIEVNGNTTVPVTGTVYVYVRLHVASNEW